MQKITCIKELEALYGEAIPASITKVVSRITPSYRRWISSARFVVLSTVGPEGADGSPRGDDGPVVRIEDDKTIMLPDWRGNNRIDSLRNIVRDPRVAMMFMIPGCHNVVRVNGRAAVTADKEICAHFEKLGKLPKTVIILSIDEVYFQCAKAIMRAKIWSGEDESKTVPTAGEFIKEMNTDFDAESYDSGYAEQAKPKMW